MKAFLVLLLLSAAAPAQTSQPLSGDFWPYWPPYLRRAPPPPGRLASA